MMVTYDRATYRVCLTTHQRPMAHIGAFARRPHAVPVLHRNRSQESARDAQCDTAQCDTRCCKAAVPVALACSCSAGLTVAIIQPAPCWALLRKFVSKSEGADTPDSRRPDSSLPPLPCTHPCGTARSTESNPGSAPSRRGSRSGVFSLGVAAARRPWPMVTTTHAQSSKNLSPV